MPALTWAQLAGIGSVFSLNGLTGAIVISSATGNVVVSAAGTTIDLDVASIIDKTTSSFKVNGKSSSKIEIDANGAINLNASATRDVTIDSGGNVAELALNHSGVATLLGLTAVFISGQVRSDQTAAATTPGTVVAKLPIYDAAGTIVGYLPLYDAIT